MTLNRRVAEHYEQADLADRIEAGFAAAGVDVGSITVDDLSVVDEFHTGGRMATEHLLGALAFEPGHRVLDIGCGVGGPARHAAAAHDLHVTGVDLTASYVAAAQRLSSWVGLEDRTSFRTVEAGPLPFADDEFDGAYLIHVGMNVADKQALFVEVARVLRPGAAFGIYDLLATDGDGPGFPVPWATEPDTSFLESADRYRDALVGAGFEVSVIDDRSEPMKAFMAEILARSAQSGPPPVGLPLLMGADAGVKLANMVAALNGGGLAPTVLVARTPPG